MTLQLFYHLKWLLSYCLLCPKILWWLFVKPEYSFDIVVQVLILKDVAAQLLTQKMRIEYSGVAPVFAIDYIWLKKDHVLPCRVPRTPQSSAVCPLQHTRCKALPARGHILRTFTNILALRCLMTTSENSFGNIWLLHQYSVTHQHKICLILSGSRVNLAFKEIRRESKAGGRLLNELYLYIWASSTSLQIFKFSEPITWISPDFTKSPLCHVLPPSLP